jgi:hypothetical protein
MDDCVGRKPSLSTPSIQRRAVIRIGVTEYAGDSKTISDSKYTSTPGFALKSEIT